MKKVLTLLVISVTLPGLVIAQRPKPVYDPETKEGLLIQHIQQETDPSEKLHFMEQFVVQYPANPMIAWVYDNLQPAYMKEKAWDDAMRIGEKRVALEQDNLDAAKLALKAAETKGNADDIAKWADCTWRIASTVAAKGGRTAADARLRGARAHDPDHAHGVRAAVRPGGVALRALHQESVHAGRRARA